jgi:hypothetical protein
MPTRSKKLLILLALVALAALQLACRPIVQSRYVFNAVYDRYATDAACTPIGDPVEETAPYQLPHIWNWLAFDTAPLITSVLTPFGITAVGPAAFPGHIHLPFLGSYCPTLFADWQCQDLLPFDARLANSNSDLILDVDYSRLDQRFEGEIFLRVKKTVSTPPEVPIRMTAVTELDLDVVAGESRVTKKVNGECVEMIVFKQLDAVMY